VKEGIEEYRFNEAASAIYQFIWHEFCDWFLEAEKPALYEKEGIDCRNTARAVFAKVLQDTLVMLHPFMPFVTEEIWHMLPTVENSIMQARFPDVKEPVPEASARNIQADMDFVFGLVSGIRNIRGEMNIQPSTTLQVLMQTRDDHETALISENRSMIENLSRLEHLEVALPAANKISSATAVVGATTVHVLLDGVIDFDREEQRLNKEIEKITKELLSISKRLNNESFLEKAPEDVVQKVNDQQAELEVKNDKLKGNLNRIQAMRG
jgi:valyl-tRNA synthetase